MIPCISCIQHFGAPLRKGCYRIIITTSFQDGFPTISAQSLRIKTGQCRSSQAVGPLVPWGNYAVCETVHRPSAGLCPLFSYSMPSAFSISIIMEYLRSYFSGKQINFTPWHTVAFWSTLALSSSFPCPLLKENFCSCSLLASQETTQGHHYWPSTNNIWKTLCFDQRLSLYTEKVMTTLQLFYTILFLLRNRLLQKPFK